MTAKHSKISLEFLNRLVAEINNDIKAAETMSSSDSNDVVLKLSRTAGLLSMLVQEGGLLIKDVFTAVQIIQQTGSLNSDPIADLDTLLGNITPPKRSAN